MYDIPNKEIMTSGHLACQGCGAPIAMRFALKALGENCVVVIPACCWTVISGPFPSFNLGVPLLHVPFETTGAAITGVRAALDHQGKEDTVVMGWAGDGGTFDIGLQSLSGAAERNENVLYVCYDNEAYMNTGIQRSSATPENAWTTTTPERSPKMTPKKNIVQIMAGHRIPYIATANVAYLDDLYSKFKKAKEIKGTRFLHILSPCPPGWRVNSEDSIKVARLATESNVFPLFEVIDGDKYVISHEPKGLPVTDYLKHQKRFAHFTEDDVNHMQARVDFEWKRLLTKGMMEPFE